MMNRRFSGNMESVFIVSNSVTAVIHRFDAIVQKDNLLIPEEWDAEITDSTVSPFSDKLLMFHAAF